MPDLKQQEPLAEIRGLLNSDWDSTNTQYSSAPLVHTGWWDWDRETLEVTVTNPETNPATSGGPSDTGYTHMQGDGSVGQRVNGYCLVNGWGGFYGADMLAGESSDGSDLSPKQCAWEFKKEITRILGQYADGTLKDDGTVSLTFVSPGTTRRVVESNGENEHPTIFRYEVECRFGYVEQH